MRGTMRRPVCLIGLAFVVLIRLYLYLHPLPAAELEDINRSSIILTGQVDKKEYRISNDQEILVIYLKEVQVVHPQTIPSEVKNVICYAEGGQEPEMGSRVRVQGKLYAFDGAANPGEFDAIIRSWIYRRGYRMPLSWKKRHPMTGSARGSTGSERICQPCLTSALKKRMLRL